MSRIQEAEREWAHNAPEVDPDHCPCQGSGWLSTPFDAIEKCWIHYDGQPHPEDFMNAQLVWVMTDESGAAYNLFVPNERRVPLAALSALCAIAQPGKAIDYGRWYKVAKVHRVALWHWICRVFAGEELSNGEKVVAIPQR